VKNFVLVQGKEIARLLFTSEYFFLTEPLRSKALSESRFSPDSKQRGVKDFGWLSGSTTQARRKANVSWQPSKNYSLTALRDPRISNRESQKVFMNIPAADSIAIMIAWKGKK
jgi:hypothetical protein